MLSCAVACSVEADLFAVDGGEVDNGTASGTEGTDKVRIRVRDISERSYQANILVRVLLQELLDLLALTQPDTNHVDVNTLLELGQGHVGRGLHGTSDSCIVDGIVDPAELLDCCFMGRDD